MTRNRRRSKSADMWATVLGCSHIHQPSNWSAEKETLEKIMVVDEYAEGVMNFAQGQASGNDLRLITELSFVKSIEEMVPATGGGSQ